MKLVLLDRQVLLENVDYTFEAGHSTPTIQNSELDGQYLRVIDLTTQSCNWYQFTMKRKRSAKTLEVDFECALVLIDPPA